VFSRENTSRVVLLLFRRIGGRTSGKGGATNCPLRASIGEELADLEAAAIGEHIERAGDVVPWREYAAQREVTRARVDRKCTAPSAVRS
jgi:hypothetical protein